MPLTWQTRPPHSPRRPATIVAMLVIGLMSGTSADGIDAALVEWPESEATTPLRLLAHTEAPFPAPLQQRIHALAAAQLPGDAVLAEYAALDVELGERFAQAAIAVAEAAGAALLPTARRSPIIRSCAPPCRSAIPRSSRSARVARPWQIFVLGTSPWEGRGRRLHPSSTGRHSAHPMRTGSC